MTKDQAIRLIGAYCIELARIESPDTELRGLIDRLPEDASEAKAMRWLGWMQAACRYSGIYSLDEIKAHSRVITSAPEWIGGVLRLRGEDASKTVHYALDLCNDKSEASQAIARILDSIAA